MIVMQQFITLIYSRSWGLEARVHSRDLTTWGPRARMVTRSERFLTEQLVGLAQTRRRVEVQLAELQRLCAAHRHKMDRAKLASRVDEALAPRWMGRLYRHAITGETREDLSLSWSFDEEAFAKLKDTELGKRIIFTDRQGSARARATAALSGFRPSTRAAMSRTTSARICGAMAANTYRCLPAMARRRPSRSRAVRFHSTPRPMPRPSSA